MLQQIIFGLGAVVIGVITLKYNYQIANFTGDIGFVERYLGAGSTYGFIKLLSVLLIIGGFLYTTGLANPILEWLLTPLEAFMPQ